MTVKELIEKLKQCPEDMTVVGQLNDPGFNGMPCTVRSVRYGKLCKHKYYGVWAPGWANNENSPEECVVLR